jgi:3-deoxy-manno-octulosonate cytidylyltransferase (CMP-KDO synthetase)
VVAIVPARFASTRLPGKPLLEMGGEPMICRVVRGVSRARNVGHVIVATDDRRILLAVEAAGYDAVMTSPDHNSGTDRVAEVAQSLPEAEIIVNVQGDEPLIAPETIERAVEELAGDVDAGIVTTWEPIESAADVLNPDVVKVVVDGQGCAVYFSRSPIPYPREAARRHGSLERALENQPELLNNFRKHTGLYVYRREVLLKFARWPQSKLERQESLEQLRALEHGVRIKVIKASTPSIGVDTPADLERVREMIAP